MRRGRRSCITLLSGAMLAGSFLFLSGCPNPFLKSASSTIVPPVISPGGGVFGTDQTVSLSSSVSGAAVYYTTDGSTPTTSSTLYAGPIAVAGNGTAETIKAIESSGGKISEVVQASFTINYSIGGTSTLAAPTFNPGGGLYTAAPTAGITLSGPSGATIYYTTDGSTPSASNGKVYSAPITIPNTNDTFTTLRAVSTESGYISSTVVSATYEISYSPDAVTPTITVAASSGGSLSSDGVHVTWFSGSPPTVSFGGGTSSTSYYYTIGYGTQPQAPTTASSSVSASSPVVTLAPTTSSYQVVTVDVVAEDPGTTLSAMTSKSFALNEQLAVPTPSEEPGRYASDQTVSFSESGVTLTPADVSLTETNYITAIGTPVSGASASGLVSASGASFTTAASTMGGTTTGELAGYTVTVTGSLAGWVSAAFTGTYYIVTPKITFTGSEQITVPSIPSTDPGGSIQSLLAKLWGAGGGGGTVSSDTSGSAAAGAGGGGGFAEQTFSVAAAGEYQVLIGAGAAGAAASASTSTPPTVGAAGGGMTAVALYSGGAYTLEAIAGGGGGGGSAWASTSNVASAGGGGQGGSDGAASTGGSDGGVAGGGGTGGIDPTGTDNYTASSDGGNQSLTSAPASNGGAINSWGGGGGSGYGGGAGAGYEFGILLSNLVTLWYAGGGGAGGADYGSIAVTNGHTRSAANNGDPDYVFPSGEGGAPGSAGGSGGAGQGGLAVIYIQ